MSAAKPKHLIVERKVGQSVICKMPDGTTIEIMPWHISRSRVRLGIYAPPIVQILRGDVNPRNNHIDYS